jgi:hypothetical protein
MPVPFLAAAALPALVPSAAGIGAAASAAAGIGAGAAAAGGVAAGAGGLFSAANIGSTLAGIGSLTGGVGSLASSMGGGGIQTGAGDFASLYTSQLAPGQARLTLAGQELMQTLAPYIRSLQMETNVQGQQAYDQFNQAISKEQTQAGLQAGIASSIASSYLGNRDLANKAKTSVELLGPEAASKALNTYTTAIGTLQNTALAGETNLLQPTVQAQAQAGLTAQQARNDLASNISKTNLDI